MVKTTVVVKVYCLWLRLLLLLKFTVVVKVYCLWLRLLLLLKFTFDVKGDTFENPYLT